MESSQDQEYPRRLDVDHIDVKGFAIQDHAGDFKVGRLVVVDHAGEEAEKAQDQGQQAEDKENQRLTTEDNFHFVNIYPKDIKSDRWD